MCAPVWMTPVHNFLSASDEMKNMMKRFDGKEMPKLAFMYCDCARDVSSRQLTVYERLLNIEPVLTHAFGSLRRIASYLFGVPLQAAA